MFSFVRILIFCFLAFFISQPIYGQKKKRRILEQKRLRLQKEIKQINAILFSTKNKEKDALEESKNLSQKIKVRTELISTLSDEQKALEIEIQNSSEDISILETEVEIQKEEYVTIIRQLYKTRKRYSILLFILSSDNFYSIYRRIQYLIQYQEYRLNQARKIQVSIKNLSKKVKDLDKKKETKKKLFFSYENEISQLEKDRKQQKKNLKNLKKKEKSYISKLRRKQSEERKLTKTIDNLIRKAILASQKKKKSKSKNVEFELTPAGKKLAKKFKKNKRRLPWPVLKGVIVRAFGKQKHPTLKNITIQSNGVYIATNKGSEARAIFDGEVISIQTLNNHKAVYLKHGNYISLYHNLKNVAVKKGQNVKAKQNLGVIFTDNVTKETILKFQLIKNLKRLNPQKWFAKS